MHSIEYYRKELNAKSKKDLVEEMLMLIINADHMQRRIEELEKQQSRSLSNYMSGCKSSGGVTLPRGF